MPAPARVAARAHSHSTFFAPTRVKRLVQAASSQLPPLHKSRARNARPTMLCLRDVPEAAANQSEIPLTDNTNPGETVSLVPVPAAARLWRKSHARPRDVHLSSPIAAPRHSAKIAAAWLAYSVATHPLHLETVFLLAPHEFFPAATVPLL